MTGKHQRIPNDILHIFRNYSIHVLVSLFPFKFVVVIPVQFLLLQIVKILGCRLLQNHLIMALDELKYFGAEDVRIRLVKEGLVIVLWEKCLILESFHCLLVLEVAFHLGFHKSIFNNGLF